MKRFTHTIFVVALAAGAAFAQQIKITFPMGDVQVQSGDAAQKAKATFNQVINSGETVISGSGARAELSRGDKIAVRLDGDTQIKITAVSKETITLNHRKGELWINNTSGDVNISIAGTAGFLNTKKATFRVSGSSDGPLSVWVYDGVVTAKPPSSANMKWQEKVPAGQQITVAQDGAFNKKDFSEGDEDSSWLKWNRQRDKMGNK